MVCAGYRETKSLVLDMLYFEILERYPNGDIWWIVYIVLNSEDISGIMFLICQ